jgi:hypothetical protein
VLRPIRVPAIALLAVLAGCQFTEPDQPVESKPLIFRSSTPADSVTGLHDPDGLDLVARFNREISEPEVTTNLLFPAPRAAGGVDVGTAGAVEIVWNDVVLDDGLASHMWLMDGPEFTRPVLLQLFPGDGTLTHVGVISGTISISPPRTTAEDAMLFVMISGAPETTFAPDTPTMLGLPIVTVRRIGPAQGVRQNLYGVGNLDPRFRYLLVAIEDTDDDGRYEPRDDWWGYPRNRLQPDTPLLVRASVFGDDDAPSSVNFEIVRPGALSPVDF